MPIASFTGYPQPLVGRERELAILRQHLDAARDGHGSLVLIGGEAGVGKTALAEALCREAEAQRAVVLIGRCYDLAETPPYGPWVDLFLPYQTAHGNPLGSMPPLPSAFARRGTVGAVASQGELLQQVYDFFTSLATCRPIAPLLDDLHWADPTSLDLFRFLARNCAPLPLLILGTYRSEELNRRHPFHALLPLLVREAAARRIDLRPLDADAVRLLVRERYRLPEADTTRLVNYLHERAEGNPFFLGELLRTIEEERVLHREGDAWMLGALTQRSVPPLIRQVIEGRFARLDPEDRRLLAVAAIIGHEVPLAVWATVAETDEETIAAAIERGADAHLLAEMPDGQRMQFAHALVREALYEGVAAVRRRPIHRRAGETLAAQRYADPDAVANHFQQAGDARAYDWLLRAGGRAQDASAWLTAAERFEAALTLAEERGIDDQERAWLLMRLAAMVSYANPARAVKIIEEGGRLADRAGDRGLAAYALLEHGIQLGQGVVRQPLALVSVEAGCAALEALTNDERARLLSNGARYAVPNVVADGRPDVAYQYGSLGRLADALRVGEPLLEQETPHRMAYNGLAEAYAALGMPERSRAMREQARKDATAHGDHSHLTYIESRLLDLVLQYDTDNHAERQRAMAAAMAAGVLASGARPAPPRIFVHHLLFLEGQWDELQRVATSAATLEEATDFVRGNGFFVLLRLWVESGERDAAWDLMRKWIPEGPTVAVGSRSVRVVVPVMQIAARLAFQENDLPTMKAWLEAHDRWLAWSGTVLGRSEGEALWGRYHRRAGDADEARAHAERALAHATEPRQPLAALAAHRLLGELATDTGRYTDAASHLATAQTIAEACTAPFERALTLLAQAEWCAATGDHRAALARLDEVRAICIPLGARPTLARADTLAAILTGRTPKHAAYPAGLTVRQVEVLRLVATGKTDREIAATLHLSGRTVSNHVAHILTKTYSENRAAAVAFAMRHGLM